MKSVLHASEPNLEWGTGLRSNNIFLVDPKLLVNLLHHLSTSEGW